MPHLLPVHVQSSLLRSLSYVFIRFARQVQSRERRENPSHRQRNPYSLYDKAKLFYPAFVFLAALHNINSCGVDTGMTEKVSQFCYIPFHPIECHGEQVAKIVRKHFAAVYTCVNVV